MKLFGGRNDYENLEPGSSSRGFIWKNRNPLRSILILLGVSCTVVVVVATLVITISPTSTSTDPNSGEGSVILKQSPEVRENDTSVTPITVNVQINDGELRGIVLQSRGGRNYSAFYNIPYATPPVGDLRFEPPQKFTGGWTEIRDATTPGERCAQVKIGSDEVKGTEDCLYLAVFTPTLPTTRSRSRSGSRSGSGSSNRGRGNRNQEGNLPVMVYFFGGAFLGGHAQGYSADYFMDTDVVLVLPEYRVGTLGNLNTEDTSGTGINGNMGFKDQVMVLRWVRDNIARFSGNSSKVTIFGNSSGGMSVHAHLFSNMSAGLFHAAISQSGSALGGDTIDTRARERAVEIAITIGCAEDLNVTSNLVGCLKAGNLSDILAAQTSDLTGLSVEVGGGEVFLSDTPINLLQAGSIVSDVPWILGANSGELNAMAAILNSSQIAQEIDANWTQFAPHLLSFDTEFLGREEVTRMVGEIRNFYFGTENISLETASEFGNMMSDRNWVHPTWVAASLYAKFSSSPVYLYWLTYEGKGEEVEELVEVESYGVGHAAEVKYFFPWAKFPYIPDGSGDYNFSKLLINIWTKFAGSGEQNLGEPFLLGDLETEWIPFGKGGEWLRLDEKPEMLRDPELDERMSFWDGFDLKSLYVSVV